jgi:hypothetical protein
MTLLFRRNDNSLVLSTRDVVKRALEMFPRILERGGVFVGLEVRVDELDEAVEVFGCYLRVLARYES